MRAFISAWHLNVFFFFWKYYVEKKRAPRAGQYSVKREKKRAIYGLLDAYCLLGEMTKRDIQVKITFILIVMRRVAM